MLNSKTFTKSMVISSKILTKGSLLASRVSPSGFVIRSTASIDHRINEKLEERVDVVVADIEKLKSINEYRKELVDTKLMNNKENFKAIHALLAQIEETVTMPEAKPVKQNPLELIKYEMDKDMTSDDDSLIKNSSFYSGWKTPKSVKYIGTKIKKLEMSHKQKRAHSFVKKVQVDLKSMLDTINLKKDYTEQANTLKESQYLAAQKITKEKVMAHKREQIMQHMKLIKKQKMKRLRILKEANKRYEEMKVKPTLYIQMEEAYNRKAEKSVKSAKLKRRKLYKPFDYDKLKEHEELVNKSFKDRMDKIGDMKKIDPPPIMPHVSSESKLQLLKKQHEFALLVQQKYKPTHFAENSLESEIHRTEYEKELKREELIAKITENRERSKAYLQESMMHASKKPKPDAQTNKENMQTAKQHKNYLPDISHTLKKNPSKSIQQVMARNSGNSSLPAIVNDVSKFESMSKSKLGVGTAGYYKSVIGAKLSLLNNMNN